MARLEELSKTDLIRLVKSLYLTARHHRHLLSEKSAQVSYLSGDETVVKERLADGVFVSVRSVDDTPVIAQLTANSLGYVLTEEKI